MAHPIVAQPVRQIANTFVYREVHRTKQRKPYNLPAPYISLRRTNGVHYRSGTPFGSASNNFDHRWQSFLITDLNSGDIKTPDFALLVSQSRNKALRNFNDKRGEKAALGIAMAEASRSASMITRRVIQLARFGFALARFRFYEASKLLGVVHDPRTRKLLKSNRLRRNSHSFANNWLEYSFGWKPMIQDMYTAAKVLSAPLAYEEKILVGGSISRKLTYTGDSSQASTSHNCTSLTSIGAVLTVENPNYDLAQRLGLANPALVAYEMVKFSFVLNWFINLEEYLSQFNQFYGVRVDKPFFGDKFIDTCTVYHPDPYPYYNTKYDIIGVSRSESFRRTVGSLPTISLGLRPAFSLPLTRALNAISLLIQLGIRKR